MRVTWAPNEQQAVTDEGVRLWLSGKAKTLSGAFAKAQAVLPKNRRRSIASTGKVPWFVSALKATPRPSDGAQASKQPTECHTLPATGDSTSAGDSGWHPKVFWKDGEKQALCSEAARLQVDLQASGPRDALMKAQERVLPPERRRKIGAMAILDDWYPDGLQKARAVLIRKREREAIEAIQATAKEQAAAASAARAPDVVDAATPTTALASAAPASLSTVFGDWTRIREHIVGEIAAMVTEGIQRGLANVQLAPPAQQPEDTPAMPARHVPFVVDPRKERPPSVLVVGLKGAQVPQIEADFGTKLDLRFCSADKSKDQLRAMTEQADLTVAFVDFLSHSHTDIIKARSRHYVESAGGMTHLRQELARIAGMQLNGAAAEHGAH